MTTYKQLPVNDLFIDERYQRPLEAARVRKIVDEFEPAMMGTLEVSDRGNGTAAVFDGQHRLAAAHELNLDTLNCLVHDGLTVEQEADLFERLQRSRKPVHNVHRLRARAVAGDNDAVGIYDALDATGYLLSTRATPNSIGSAGVLSELHRYGVLLPTLRLVREVWGGDEGSTYWPLLRAVGEVIWTSGELTVEQRARLRKVSPVDITRRARGRALKNDQAHAVQVVSYIADEIRRVAKLRKASRGEPTLLLSGTSVLARSYAYVSEHPYATAAQVASELGVREAHARGELKALVSQQHLASWGTAGSRVYGLPGAPAPHPKFLVRPDTKAAAVTALVEEHPWSTVEQVRSLMNDDPGARSSLLQMVKQGVLTARGPKGRERYALAGTQPPVSSPAEDRAAPPRPPAGEWAGRLLHAIKAAPGGAASEASRSAGVPSAEGYKLVEQFIAAGVIVRRGDGLYPVSDTITGDSSLAASATSRNSGLTPSMARLLVVVTEQPGQTVAGIAKAMGLSQRTVNSTAGQLEAKALIRRAAGAGGRAQQGLHPTTAASDREVRIRAGEGVLAA